MQNRKDYLDEFEQRYTEKLKKSRNKSAKRLYLYVLMLILAVGITITNGFSWDKLILYGFITFCILVSLHNRKVLKKSDVKFITEYLENKETDYIDHDYDNKNTDYIDHDYDSKDTDAGTVDAEYTDDKDTRNIQ